MKIFLKSYFGAVGVVALLVVLGGCGQAPASDGQEGRAVSGYDTAESRCAAHNAPEDLCFICDPTLRDEGRLWCREHDRYEDRCFLCHPELEEIDRLWCAEHSLYEDECFLCHPELANEATTSGGSIAGLQCMEHELLESECGICHPDLAADLEPGEALKVRLESAESASHAGIRAAPPNEARNREESSFLARVTWDQNNYAHVTPLAGGVVREVEANVGDTVRKGQRIATLNSPEIARAKSAYLSARAEEELTLTVLERERRLVKERVSAQQDLDQAKAEHLKATNETAMARQHLLNFGLTEQAIRHLAATGSTSSALDILAPLSGTIVDRHAVAGEVVRPGDAVFAIASLATMWLELSIPENRVASVSLGQEVVATFDAQPGLRAEGQVTWIGSSVDESSRMVKGRAEVPNPDRMLRNGMFGQARLLSSMANERLVVPRDAVQYLDDRAFVFVRLSNDLFELRRVVLGAADGPRMQIAQGLAADDDVVIEHSFTLKAELLKSRLGAGCVHD
jgi:cobalt-zinc-cadmium efflux system membrane fusion protein